MPAERHEAHAGTPDSGALDGTQAKLVRMANQIAVFFRSQPQDDGPAGVALHINKFWEPRMRRSLLTLVDQGNANLDPLVMAAAALIKRPHSDAPAIGTGADAAAGAPGGKGPSAGESLSEPSLPEQRAVSDP